MKKLLSYLLSIGNILNGGTPKGQADGFTLDIITKLGQIKDSNGRNILYTICNFIQKEMKEEEKFENVKKDFPCLAEAGKLSFCDITPSLNKLKKEIDSQSEMIKILAINKDDFYKRAEKLYTQYKKEVEALEKLIDSNIKVFQETVSFFGYEAKDSKYKSQEEFFNLINDFLNEVEKNIPKSDEPKKNYNKLKIYFYIFFLRI